MLTIEFEDLTVLMVKHEYAKKKAKHVFQRNKTQIGWLKILILELLVFSSKETLIR